MFVQGQDGSKGDKGSPGSPGNPGEPGLRGKDVSKSSVDVPAMCFFRQNPSLFSFQGLTQKILSQIELRVYIKDMKQTEMLTFRCAFACFHHAKGDYCSIIFSGNIWKQRRPRNYGNLCILNLSHSAHNHHITHNFN